MTTVNSTLSPALERALDLLIEPPTEPDASKGYLDLLGSSAAEDEGPARNTGPIQAVWASSIGSMLYDNAQALSRRFLSSLQHPIEWLNIPQGGIALDVGAGPGSITASLARAAGPEGLALGVDISEPMLARAVRAQAGPQVGFLRADAQRLPFRDQTFDAALAGMAGLRPRGPRMAVMVPPPRRAGALTRLLPDGGAHFFTEDEIGDTLEDLGLVKVRTNSVG